MFLDVLESLMKERGLNKSTLSKLSGVPYTTIDGFFKKGFENTKLSTLRQLSQFFEVTLDYLVTGESEKSPQILTIYNQLNDLGKQKANTYLNDLVKIPDYQKESPVTESIEERQQRVLKEYKESLQYEKAAFGEGVQTANKTNLTPEQERELIRQAKEDQ